MLDRISPDTRVLLGQLIRYGITGGAVTAVAAAVYWSLATYAGVPPLLANVAAYVVAVAVGFTMHSRWSFQGHGAGESARTTSKFFAVSLVSFGLNSLWVWLFTGLLHGPTWWPIVPMLAVTPFVVFALNRKFVFGL